MFTNTEKIEFGSFIQNNSSAKTFETRKTNTLRLTSLNENSLKLLVMVKIKQLSNILKQISIKIIFTIADKDDSHTN